MLVTKEIELDYGHTLPDHYSFCNQIHGHRAVVRATVSGAIQKETGNSSNGMILDFSELKKILMDEIHGKLDHGFAVWKFDTRCVIEDVTTLSFISARNQRVLITEQPPTAEVLAKWAFGVVYKKILEQFPRQDFYLLEITWFETPKSRAVYTFEDYTKDRNAV